MGRRLGGGWEAQLCLVEFGSPGHQEHLQANVTWEEVGTTGSLFGSQGGSRSPGPGPQSSMVRTRRGHSRALCLL